MPKPDKLPEWGTSGSAAIIEPSSTKKALGWIKQKPPFQYFNWWMNKVYKWIEWLDLRPAFEEYATPADLGAVAGALDGALASVKGYGQYKRRATYAGPIDGETAITSVDGGAWVMETAHPDAFMAWSEVETDAINIMIEEKIGTLTRMISVTFDWDPASIAVDSQVTLDVTVPGAGVNDLPFFGAIQTGLSGTLIPTALVPSPNVVRVRLGNSTAAAVDPGLTKFRIVLFSF